MSHAGDAVAHVDRGAEVRRLHLDADVVVGDGLHGERVVRLLTPRNAVEVLVRQAGRLLEGRVPDEHDDRVVGNEPGLEQSTRVVALEDGEVRLVALVPVDGRDDAARGGDRLLEDGVGSIQVAEPLLPEDPDLGVEAAPPAVPHAVGLDPKEHLELLRGQVDVELHVLLLGLRGEARPAGPLVVAVHLFGVDEGLRLDDRLVQQVDESIDLRCGHGSLEVVIDAPLTKLAARAVALLDELALDVEDPVQDGLLPLPVVGADGRRALEHEVLEEVGAPEPARLLDDRAEAREDLARHARLRVVFENQQAQSVVERRFLDDGHRRGEQPDAQQRHVHGSSDRVGGS